MKKFFKKIMIFVLAFILMACTLQVNTNISISDSELIKKINSIMPEKVNQELNNNLFITRLDNTILVGNDKENPSLRLDFTYEDDKLVYYVSKEYGYIDGIEDNLINENKAILLAGKFSEEFLNQTSEFEIIPNIKRYDSDNFFTLKDQFGNIYVIQLNKNIIVLFSSDGYH